MYAASQYQSYELSRDDDNNRPNKKAVDWFSSSNYLIYFVCVSIHTRWTRRERGSKLNNTTLLRGEDGLNTEMKIGERHQDTKETV